jgi:hypothetical protein
LHCRRPRQPGAAASYERRAPLLARDL